MNDNIKKIGLVAGVVLILVLGIFFLGKKPANNQDNSNPATEQIDEAAKMPDFILGKVGKVEGQTVTLTVGLEQKIAIMGPETTFIKQVKNKDSYKNVPATLADVKVGLQIVVYYSARTASDYTAGKVQILPF